MADTEYLIECIRRAVNGFGDPEWKEETIARLQRLDEICGWQPEPTNAELADKLDEFDFDRDWELFDLISKRLRESGEA